MVLALLVYSFRDDSCCLLPVVLWAPWETCHPQQGSSGLLGWEQASLRVPCHLGAVLRTRRSPEGAAGAGDAVCLVFPPSRGAFPGGCVGAAEVGGSLGLVGVVPPVTAVPPVLCSPGSGLAEHLLLQLRCWLHGTLLWVLVLGLVMRQLV